MLTLRCVCPGNRKTSSDNELVLSPAVQPLMLIVSLLADSAHGYPKTGSNKLMSSVHSVGPRGYLAREH